MLGEGVKSEGSSASRLSPIQSKIIAAILRTAAEVDFGTSPRSEMLKVDSSSEDMEGLAKVERGWVFGLDWVAKEESKEVLILVTI